MRSKMALKIYAISKQKSSPTNWTALIMSEVFYFLAACIFLINSLKSSVAAFCTRG
jgi:hypothetical protein